MIPITMQARRISLMAVVDSPPPDFEDCLLTANSMVYGRTSFTALSQQLNSFEAPHKYPNLKEIVSSGIRK